MSTFKFSLVSSMVLLGISGLAFSSSSSTSISADFKKITDFFTRPYKHKNNHVDLLFLQQADSGSIVAMPRKKGCYKLQLSNLHENVLYFTDQPKRNAGNITNQEFMEVWKHNTIVPNVAMQAFTVSPDNVHEMSLIATLKNPYFNMKNQTVSYTACIIPKNKVLNIQKAELRSISLFIDPLHEWPP